MGDSVLERVRNALSSRVVRTVGGYGLKPSAVLLLPDQRAAVGPLIRWYDRIRRELGVPVTVGVRPPPDGSP